MAASKKKKAPPASTNPARDLMIVSLREQGFTYDAIAHKLHAAGHTEHVVSRVRIEKYVRRLAPHLCGAVKHKMKLDKLTRVKDIHV